MTADTPHALRPPPASPLARAMSSAALELEARKADLAKRKEEHERKKQERKREASAA